MSKQDKFDDKMNKNDGVWAEIYNEYNKMVDDGELDPKDRRDESVILYEVYIILAICFIILAFFASYVFGGMVP